jgi:hypothetical protein
VPPPPVGGAAAGNGLGDGLCVADGDADELAEGLADELAEGLALALGVVTLAVPLGRIVGDAEPVPAGENVAGVAEGWDVVQAEIAAEASMVTMPQPTAASLALSPVPTMVVRILTGSPHASGGWRIRFPVPHRKSASEGKAYRRPGRCPRRPRAGPRKRREP